MLAFHPVMLVNVLRNSSTLCILFSRRELPLEIVINRLEGWITVSVAVEPKWPDPLTDAGRVVELVSFEAEPKRPDPPNVYGDRVVELVLVVLEPRTNPLTDAGWAVHLMSIEAERRRLDPPRLNGDRVVELVFDVVKASSDPLTDAGRAV